MAKESYCSFEVAKLLKEKGFDESIRCWYDNFQDFHEEGVRMRNTDCLPPTIMCPTHQMAMAWLREKGIYICPKYCCFCGSKKKDVPYFLWEPRILRLSTNNIIYPQLMDMCEHYKSYEEAVEAAIKYTLENLL